MSPIKNVLIIGAGGNVGRSTIKAFRSEPGKFQITGLTRNTSEAKLPAGVRHVKTDYSQASLFEAFQGQDAVISTLSGGGLDEQRAIVDAAIAAEVKVFFPSEYGVDTSIRAASQVIPFLASKIAALDYLKSKQDKISWTAIITGSVFDWGLNIPGFGGLNVPAHTSTIYDGGNIAYDATNLDQVGKAIVAALKQPELTKNQYVYVNSFTITQNQVLEAVEKVTGEKFTVSQSTSEELWQESAAQVQEGQGLAVLGMVASSCYQKGANLKLSNYSVNRGLWNDRLGLAQENLEEVLKSHVAASKV